MLDICVLAAAMQLLMQPCAPTVPTSISCRFSIDQTKRICALPPDARCPLPQPVTYTCKRADGTTYDWQGE